MHSGENSSRRSHGHGGIPWGEGQLQPMWQGSQVPGERTLTRSCPFTEKLCTLRSIKSYDSSDSGGVPNERYDPGKLFHCFVTRALILSNQDDGARPPS